MKQFNVDEIINATSQVYGVPVSDILGKSRKRHIVEARQMAMFICLEINYIDWEKLKNTFNRDRVTMIYAYNKLHKWVYIYNSVNKMYMNILAILLNDE